MTFNVQRALTGLLVVFLIIGLTGGAQAGTLFGVEIVADQLLTINTTTGAATTGSSMILAFCSICCAS